MIVGFHHVQISVPTGNAERVREFYGKFLGMMEIPVPASMVKHGLIWFAAGHSQLHVSIEDKFDRSTTRTHIAYEVDDIANWRIKLKAAGIEIFDQPKVDGFDRVHILDPFGNRVEIIGRDICADGPTLETRGISA